MDAKPATAARMYGLVWTQEWRPSPTDPTDFADNPPMSGVLAGVGRVR